MQALQALMSGLLHERAEAQCDAEEAATLLLSQQCALAAHQLLRHRRSRVVLRCLQCCLVCKLLLMH